MTSQCGNIIRPNCRKYQKNCTNNSFLIFQHVSIPRESRWRGMFRQAIENLRIPFARISKPSPEELRECFHVVIRDLPRAEPGARGRGLELCFQSRTHQELPGSTRGKRAGMFFSSSPYYKRSRAIFIRISSLLQLSLTRKFAIGVGTIYLIKEALTLNILKLKLNMFKVNSN